MLKKFPKVAFALPLLVMPMVIGKIEPVRATILGYQIMADLENGDSVSGTLFYDTEAVDQNPDVEAGLFDLLDWNITVNGFSFQKQSGEKGELAQGNLGDNLFQFFSFVNPIGAPNRAQLELGIASSFPGNPNEPAEIPENPSGSGGFFADLSTSPPSLPVFIVSGSVKATPIPESSSSTGLIAFGILGAASISKRKLKHSKKKGKTDVGM